MKTKIIAVPNSSRVSGTVFYEERLIVTQFPTWSFDNLIIMKSATFHLGLKYFIWLALYLLKSVEKNTGKLADRDESYRLIQELRDYNDSQ